MQLRDCHVLAPQLQVLLQVPGLGFSSFPNIFKFQAPPPPTRAWGTGRGQAALLCQVAVPPGPVPSRALPLRTGALPAGRAGERERGVLPGVCSAPRGEAEVLPRAEADVPLR